MKIALCQLDPLVGDIEGNTERLRRTVEAFKAEAVDLFIFPELFLQGYPPRDLLEKRWFINRSAAALEALRAFSQSVPDTGLLFGTVLQSGKTHGKPLANGAVLLCGGRILLRQHKTLLPTYDVFDETRYFEPSAAVNPVRFKDEVLGISICEDAWNDPDLWQTRLYEREPVSELAAAGATILINISASPFHMGKEQLRYNVMRNHAFKHRLPFIFVNQIGGNDDLIFDGNSMVFTADGSLRHALPAFNEAVIIVDTDTHTPALTPPEPDRMGSVHDALILGVSDYVRKCGFSSVVIGLSGGIDSAVTAAIAARAVGPENVWGVTMPSRYSSRGSISDSQLLAEKLGIRFSEIPIEKAFGAFTDMLDPFFSGLPPSLAEENLQARIRGTLLMGLSNKFNMLLLSTGNKSELAVGYSTLYGDMNGGMSVISDLPKQMVYQLASYINRGGEIIPGNTITKAPSAELRPDQKDQDTLPPYPVLDAILERLIERGQSQGEILADGYDAGTVGWVAQAIARNEYKRRQAPTGLKVTPKAFGSGRRFPIAARYSWS